MRPIFKARSFDVKDWDCGRVVTLIERKKLDHDPPYQRMGVWTSKNKADLIKSVIARFPMGALTVLKSEDEYGDSSYEVIDGKQRVSAIWEFRQGHVSLTRNEILSLKYKALADLVNEASLRQNPKGPFNWLDMTQDFIERFQSYKIAVIILDGSQADAQEAFERMNRTVYRLEPQEIRNAAYSGSTVLRACKSLADETSWPKFKSTPLVDWNIVPPKAIQRMKDIQFYAELLYMLSEGSPQNRRDKLDDFFAASMNPTHSQDQNIRRQERVLRSVFEQIRAIFGSEDLQQHGFRQKSENDLYALVGALHGAKVSDAQLSKWKGDLRSSLGSFRALVDDAIQIQRQGLTLPEDLNQESVRQYAGSMLGGQVNAKKRRAMRASILQAIVEDVVGTKDPRRLFSDYERRKIWRASPDKVCARCGLPVEWSDYHAGHKVSHGLAGATVIANAQVEHRTCNLKAGVDLG